MHTRHHLVQQCQRRAWTLGCRRRETNSPTSSSGYHITPTTSRQSAANHRFVSSSVPSPRNFSLPQQTFSSSSRRRRRARAASTYHFHSTVKTSQSSAASVLNGDDDNKSNSNDSNKQQEGTFSFPKSLPKDIFYTDDAPLPLRRYPAGLEFDDNVDESNDNHLDQELGLDSKWDSPQQSSFDHDETDEYERDGIDSDYYEEDDLEDIEDLLTIQEESYISPPSPLTTTTTISQDSLRVDNDPSSTTRTTSHGPSTPLSPPSSSSLLEESSPSPIAVMEMLRNFDPEERPTSGNAEELQLWLECFSQREAVTRHQQLVEKARDRKAFDAMSLMQRHIVQWFQGLRDAIGIRQKEYISNTDNRRASKRYGPYLCSLHPEKMAVIVSQEAIMQALLCTGKEGPNGITLVKMAKLIGKAVETEVVSQRRIKERYRTAYNSVVGGLESTEDEDDEELAEDSIIDSEDTTAPSESSVHKEYPMDRWAFSASHLKLFWDDMKRMGMSKNKRSVQYAMKRAKQAMNGNDTWTEDDLTHVGAALLSILIEQAKINDLGKEEPAFRVEKRWRHDAKSSKSTSYVTIHDKLYKIFLEDDYMSWAATTTRHLPMVVPPSKWTDPMKGGYRWLEVNMMRTHGSSVQREALQQADLSSVYDGLDILGKTAWRINREILEVGQKCWTENIAIGDIPSQTDFEMPPEPVRPNFENNEMYGKEDPDQERRKAVLNTYRDSISKWQRILQKNMVSNIVKRGFRLIESFADIFSESSVTTTRICVR